MQAQNSRLVQAIPRMAVLGGSLLTIHYVLQLAYGLQTGSILWEDMGSTLGRIDGPVFTTAFATIALTLVALATAHYLRLNYLKYGVLFFGVVSFLCAMIGLMAVLFWQMVPYVMPIACLTMFVSAILLSIATLKARILPTWVRSGLLAFGVFTAPLGLTFLELEGMLPLYALFELHFMCSGLLWVAMGIALELQNRRDDQGAITGELGTRKTLIYKWTPEESE